MQAFDRVVHGSRELLLVTGISGVGKSLLVHEIQKPVTIRQGYFISGKFNQFQRNIPYSAFTHAFNQFCNILLSEPPAALPAWKEKILNALGGNGQVLVDMMPRLELIIGPQPAVSEVGLQEKLNRFNLYFQYFMRAVSRPDHPLVLFIDDLQWADAASLHLLNLIMADEQSRHILMIAAYRDNEVTPAHPLMRTLEEIENAETKTEQIHVAGLARDDVTAMIHDTLGRPDDGLHQQHTHSLSALIHEKTAGNAFFVTRFFQSLYEDELLRFDAEQKSWKWDMQQIRTREITDNVVDLMVNKIRRLARPAQEILKLASCVGNTFDLNILSVIREKPPAETITDLMEAIAEGLIIPLDEQYRFVTEDTRSDDATPASFKFVHDRVEQAAYSLIDTDKRKATHLRIGRLLLDNTPDAELDTHIFDLVHQLNQGEDLVTETDERVQIANLNLQAARKAKNATAYAPALNYATFGLHLLPNDAWQSCYQLTLHLHEAAAEAAYASRDYEQMDRRIDDVLKHAKAHMDMVKVYEVKIESFKTNNQLTEAVRTGLRILRLLGISFPEKPSSFHIVISLMRTKLALVGKPVASFAGLPDMTDPEKQAALRILLSIGSAAYSVTPKLVPLLVFKDVFLSVKYGNTAAAPINYATYAFSLCGVLGDIENGYQFGRMALKLMNQSGITRFRAKTLFIVHFFVTHWKEHAANALPPFLEGYQSGLETGDFEYTGFSINAFIRYGVFIGKALPEIEQTIQLHLPMMRQLKQEVSLHNMMLCRQVIANLKGESDRPHLIAGEYYDEEEMPVYIKENRSLVITFYLYKLILSYLFSEYTQAMQMVNSGEPYLDATKGSLLIPVFHFYASLTRLALFSDASHAEQKTILKQVAKSQKKMKKWAFHAPMNFQHKWDLVEAERCRVTGKFNAARQWYEKAIKGGKENQYVNEQAIADELAGRFYLEIQVEDIAKTFLKSARAAYRQWGAQAKVKDLETHYPEYLSPTAGKSLQHPPRISVSDSTVEEGQTGKLLDIESLFKSFQTLSGQIRLESLLKEMMRLLIENAGAETGRLILSKDGQWYAEAEGRIDADHVDVLQGILLSETSGLSKGIVHYVIRTQETVVLNDAVNEGDFTHDDHVRGCGLKSVLCMPLMYQGKHSGILYLENSRAVGAFTPDRVHVLTLLSSQAAIAIENARLYDQLAEYSQTLETRVEERTRELSIAREKAEVANQAKSTFLANMTHELRSPLNTILGFAQIMTRSRRIDPENMENLSIINRSGEHLLGLINQVLDLSKIEAGHMVLNIRDCNIGRILDDVEDMFRLKAEEKGLFLLFERGKDVPMKLRTDELKLRQVLINLLNNALKFTSQGGITVSVTKSMSDVDSLTLPYPSGTDETRLFQKKENGEEGISTLRFEVRDTGLGIPEDEMDSLFEAFEQTSSGRAAMEGTGLGLPISRRFVQMMGGDMRAESTPGKGTVLYFDIRAERIADDQAQTEAFHSCRVVAPVPGQPDYRVLIVDDKPANRLLLVKLLEPLGFQIKEAENGEQAVHIWEDWMPHLIWMDLRMPVLDGCDATIRIKKKMAEQDEQQPQTRIIAITASMVEEEDAVIRSTGCDDFLRKPFRNQDIFNLMTKHIGVKFRYEDNRVAEKTEKAAVDLPGALEKLPRDLPEQLQYAVSHSDMDLIDRVIGDIRTYDSDTADALNQLANNFQYERLLTMLKAYQSQECL